jgi:hypothetical protein
MFYLLQLLADWFTYSVFRLLPGSILAQAINFFIFDTIKIFILLIVIIFAVSLIRSFLPPERIRTILLGKKVYFSNILAAALGIFTPFCTCSAIPLFLGFIQAGIPLGVTFSFLVASPMINEVALVLLLGLFGWKVALLYVGSGFLIAIFSGLLIGQMKVENLVEPSVYQNSWQAKKDLMTLGWLERLAYAKDYTGDILRKIWPYIILGIGLGAWIHGYVPADFLAHYAGANKWYAVPLATLLGIPLYSNAAGVIPFVSVLTEKGLAMGTTLAFMMAVTALSLPEFMILRRVMKIRLILIFAGIVSGGIIFVGYLFNFILK